MASLTEAPVRHTDPSALGVTCRHCGATSFQTAWQTFADGSRHIRMDCGTCGKFARYLPQGESGAPAFKHEPPRGGRDPLRP